jgi:cytochrome c
MNKIILSSLLIAGSSMLFSSALYKPCAGCHGQKAEKKALGKSAIIAGWDEAKTIEALKGYKKGTYGGPMKGVMRGQVARLNDAQMAELAKYIKGLK